MRHLLQLGRPISLSRKWRTPSRSYTLRMAWTSSGGTALAACAPAAARFDMLTFGPVQMMVGPVEHNKSVNDGHARRMPATIEQKLLQRRSAPHFATDKRKPLPIREALRLARGE